MNLSQSKNEKKVFLAKDDDFERTIEILRKIDAGVVILSIPRNSVLGASLVNFEKLKREADILAKEVIIEAIDEHISQLASMAGFKVYNPFFKKQERLVADILAKPLVIKKQELRLEEFENVIVDDNRAIVDENKTNKSLKFFKNLKENKEKKEQSTVIRNDIYRNKLKRPFLTKNLLKLLGLILLMTVLGFVVLFYLPKVDITIVLKKEYVDFDEVVELRKDVFGPQVLNNKIVIPAEFLTARHNIEMRFPASGYQKVELKAKGKLIVYNYFSSEPQPLVATTRFLSPDGKIFRLDKGVVIPGAKIVDGKINPSSIIVEVTADKAGVEYNIGKPQGRWFIPGFSGTPKYDKFYAEAFSVFEGGFVGEKAIPTDDDINNAKAVLEKTLKDTLYGQFVTVGDELEFINQLSMFKLIKFEVNGDIIDADNNFSVFGEGEMYQVGFDKESLKNILIEKINQPLQAKLSYPLVVSKFDFAYGEAQIDFEKGIASLSVSGKVIFTPLFDVESFRKEIVNLKGEELRQKTYKINGFERAKIVFWPFWVNKVPSKESRINLVVD